MRITIALLILAAVSGCASLDAFIGEETVQAQDEHGRLLYETPDGEITVVAADPQSGTPYQPHTVKLVKPRLQTDWLNGLGPWGALAGALATIATGVYARVRNQQRLQTQSRLDRTSSAMTFVLQMIEQIKEGRAVDGNGRGEISLAEVKQWVRDQGARFEDPALLEELVRLANTRQ